VLAVVALTPSSATQSDNGLVSRISLQDLT
jgi:hypothetical protein